MRKKMETFLCRVINDAQKGKDLHWKKIILSKWEKKRKLVCVESSMMLKMVRKYIKKIILCPNEKKNGTNLPTFLHFFFTFFSHWKVTKKFFFQQKNASKIVKNLYTQKWL